MNKLRKEIDNFNNNIKDIINKLNKVMENMEIYYRINDNILKTYEIKKRNYIMLQNINEINNNIIEEIEELKQFNNDNNINNKFNKIIEIYKRYDK